MLLDYVESETQSVEAVAGLLKFLGRPSCPLPESVDLGRLMLVLSNKRDVYYTTSRNSCSCPSAFYRPSQRCKHQRKYFPVDSAIGSKRQSMAETLAQAEDDLDSIIPKTKWAGGFNGPCEPGEIDDREKTTYSIVRDTKSRQNQEA